MTWIQFTASENDLGSPSRCCPATGGNAMDLIADRGRRVAVEELNTSRLLAHARKQAQQRKLDDVFDRRRRRASLRERIAGTSFFRSWRTTFCASSCSPAAPRAAAASIPNLAVGFQDMGGRITRYPHALLRKDRAGQAARRRARASLDGRDERRLFLPVSDLDALGRPASRSRNGGRAVLGLQSLAHRKGAARRPAAGSIRC